MAKNRGQWERQVTAGLTVDDCVETGPEVRRQTLRANSTDPKLTKKPVYLAAGSRAASFEQERCPWKHTGNSRSAAIEPRQRTKDEREGLVLTSYRVANHLVRLEKCDGPDSVAGECHVQAEP